MPPKRRVAAQKRSRRWANARKEAAEAEPDVEPVELEEEACRNLGVLTGTPSSNWRVPSMPAAVR